MKVFSPSSAVAVASLAATVNAHGYISQPAATYQPNTVYTTYNALTSASINSGFDGGHYNWSPSQNAQAFTDHWNATGYKSLREMLDPIAPDYGYSLETADPVDVSGYTEMWWQNDEYKEGFIASHEGPCEAWIDDTMIFHHDNCAAEYTSYPAKVPADYSSCKGDCLFVFYWLALHEPDWQIYKQCVPITNGGSTSTSMQTTSSTESSYESTPSTQTQASSSTGGSTENEASDPTQTTAPVATTAPLATTTAPETETAPEAAPAAETATEAPVSATSAPTTTEAATDSGKCVRRRH